MKFKIFSALMLSVFSLQAMAYEGKGFKIISEKVMRSPGFKGGFEEILHKKIVNRKICQRPSVGIRCERLCKRLHINKMVNSPSK